MGDLLDPPARRTEGEHVAHPGLVDHLLVQLADPPAGRVPAGRVAFADQEDAEQPAIGDGAAGGDGQSLGSGTCGQYAGVPLPDQPRSELGEVLRRIAAAEHVEHRVVRAAGQVAEAAGPPDQGIQLVGLGLLDGHHGDDLLGEHVQRIPQLGDLLDGTLPHPLDHHRRLDQIAAVVGEEDPPGGCAHLMAGPSDPLQATGHRRGRLHLDHHVDRAHVDAELEGRRGDHAGQLARLEILLDLRPLLLAHRPVVGAGDDRAATAVAAGRGARLRHHLGGRWKLLGRFAEPLGLQLVEMGGQSLSQPA